MFLTAVLIILLVSVLLSFKSLKDLKKNSKVDREVKRELSRGRVIFHKDNK